MSVFTMVAMFSAMDEENVISFRQLLSEMRERRHFF